MIPCVVPLLLCPRGRSKDLPDFRELRQQLGCAVGAPVVENDDTVDETGEMRQAPSDVALFIEYGNDCYSFHATCGGQRLYFFAPEIVFRNYVTVVSQSPGARATEAARSYGERENG